MVLGGGITWDSTAPDEYAEALLKAALLSERWPAFELLETLRLADGAYTLRDRHLARLAESAGYFGIPPDLADAVAALAHAARTVPAGPQRVRLLVLDGAARAEHQPLAGAAQPGAPLPVAWVHAPISTRSVSVPQNNLPRGMTIGAPSGQACMMCCRGTSGARPPSSRSATW
ncbi:MAG: aminotransferase class IV [Kouleothrix sp.]